MQAIDIFATKGVEYVFAGAFLLALVGFWKLINPPSAVAPLIRRILPWFQLRDDAFFHQGHGWVVPAGHSEALVGMDDFAQKLLGKPNGFVLPSPGTRVRQGEPAWQVQVDGHAIPMVSPVDGEVVAVNQDVVASPELVNTEPYDRGWLMRVKVPSPAAAARNLLSGKLARAWMDAVTEDVRAMPAGELGVVLPDGGFPIGGFARALSPDSWDRVARELLLTD
jgi:glycine cleavage system H protein